MLNKKGEEKKIRDYANGNPSSIPMESTVDMVEIVVLAVEELPARKTSETRLLDALLNVVLPPVPGVRALRHHLAAIGALDVQSPASRTVRPSLRC